MPPPSPLSIPDPSQLVQNAPPRLRVRQDKGKGAKGQGKGGGEGGVERESKRGR